jgi:hypothetical protein
VRQRPHEPFENLKLQMMPAKVQFFSSILIWLSLAAVVALTGCKGTTAEETGEEEEQGVVSGQFGDPYQIVTNFVAADPDFMPQLVEDTLVAKITYSGGCRDHDFDLRHQVAQDTARLWLLHQSGGDDCEALVQDEIRMHVPVEVMDTPVIVLLPPQGGPPIMVRWGE